VTREWKENWNAPPGSARGPVKRNGLLRPAAAAFERADSLPSPPFAW